MFLFQRSCKEWKRDASQWKQTSEEHPTCSWLDIRRVGADTQTVLRTNAFKNRKRIMTGRPMSTACDSRSKLVVLQKVSILSLQQNTC